MRRRAITIIAWVLACGSVSGQHWPSFRGPAASGVADGSPTPVKWSAATGENVLWKTPLAGVAVSSPIAWGDRIFFSPAVTTDPAVGIPTALSADIDPLHDH